MAGKFVDLSEAKMIASRPDELVRCASAIFGYRDGR
jgi:hypothetical protein